jgi:hypothetical protein
MCHSVELKEVILSRDGAILEGRNQAVGETCYLNRAVWQAM